MNRFWAPGLGRTILFSLAVVSFVIGAYQTVLQNDKNAVMDNYWLFMISFICTLLHRFTRPQPDPKAPEKPQGPVAAKPVPRNKRRG